VVTAGLGASDSQVARASDQRPGKSGIHHAEQQRWPGVVVVPRLPYDIAGAEMSLLRHLRGSVVVSPGRMNSISGPAMS
jgi:hypothetical protein